MTTEQIIAMLRDIVEEVDYDIFKEMFPEDGESEISIERLIEIVRNHI